MKQIVTKAYSDGTFAEVGTNTRVVVTGLKTIRGILNRVEDWRRDFSKDKPLRRIRIEWFPGDSILGNPYKVTYHD